MGLRRWLRLRELLCAAGWLVACNHMRLLSLDRMTALEGLAHTWRTTLPAVWLPRALGLPGLATMGCIIPVSSFCHSAVAHHIELL